jgi:hypothetical protein
LPGRIAAVPDAPGNHAAAADGFRSAANEGRKAYRLDIALHGDEDQQRLIDVRFTPMKLPEMLH